MTRKAVALISGGLDSLLAARLIQQQGVQVEGINFFTKAKVVTSRWPDPSTSTIDLGFPQNI